MFVDSEIKPSSQRINLDNPSLWPRPPAFGGICTLPGLVCDSDPMPPCNGGGECSGEQSEPTVPSCHLILLFVRGDRYQGLEFGELRLCFDCVREMNLNVGFQCWSLFRGPS